jgi:anti-sigma regulatory factor (Ser/Thr protein kinase)
LSEEKCEEIDVALDEACTNVVRHAFAPGVAGGMALRFALCFKGSVLDRGRRFCAVESAATASEKRRRDPASDGDGLLLIERLDDAAQYQWNEQEGNRLTLVKYN